MTLVRGATILDLIAEVPPGAQGFIPAEISRFIDLLNVAEIRTRSSDGFFVHEGRVQSATEAGLNLGTGFPVEIPGLNVGVPFQLAWSRPELSDPADMAEDELEGEPTAWTLDLFLDRVAVIVPIGRAGRVVPTSAVAPAYMEAAGANERVKLYARGVLRIAGGANGTQVRLIADPDPIVPTTAIGAVIETGFSPPHLLLHDSGFGLTVDRVILDLSAAYTPPEIVARGHDASFEGLSLREATLYFPRNIPFVGDVNAGVRDIIVGWAPETALQGSAHLELGIPLESATGLVFFQEVEGEVVTLGGPSGAGLALTVTVNPTTGGRARLFAEMGTPGVEAIFELPGGQRVTGGSSGWFEVPIAPGARSLKVTERRTNPEGATVDGQQRTFAFVHPAGDLGQAPHLRVAFAGHPWDEVTALRGTRETLGALTFSAIAGSLDPTDQEALAWRWEQGGGHTEGSGVTFSPDVEWTPGTHTITLTDRHGNLRRCRIEAITSAAADEPLFVGHRGGGVRQVTPTTDQAAPLASVENSWDLAAFHARDGRDAAPSPATLDAGLLTVPKGTLAEVTLALGTPQEPSEPPPATIPPIRKVRIRMVYNQTTPTHWRKIRGRDGQPYGPARPYPRFSGATASVDHDEERLSSTFSSAALQDWTATLPATTQYLVVGRTCDLGTLRRNVALANERSAHGRQLLIDAGVDPARIREIGEQGLVEDPEGDFYDHLTFPDYDPLLDTALIAHVSENWQIRTDYPDPVRTAWGDAQERAERKEARGVEIYAVVPASSSFPEVSDDREASAEDPARIRMLVPGEDATAITPQEAASTHTPYRVEIKATWDSPSIVEDIDWVPTLAQITVEWASSAVPVPGLPPGETVEPTRPTTTPSSGPDLWRVIGRFTTDPRSGQTSYLLSLDSMGDADGLFAIVQPGPGRADEAVAVALALAPALLGGITTDDPAGAGVRVAALIAASAAAAAVELGGDYVIKDGKVIVEKLEGEVRLRAIDATEGMKVRLGVDYTASFGVQAEVAGAVGVATTKPIKITYKNVGLEYEHDTTKPMAERLRFVFEDARFEVADPGRWRITGALGELLGITAIRVGAGSVWIEVDIEFAIDLGVVEISRTTIRVEIDTSGSTPKIDVSLRGITAKIEIPGAIKGRGDLQILPDGFGASLALEIIPAKLKAWGGFAYREPNMVHIEAGVRFATGIPLGGTGLGLFGFAGRFVANGRRAIDKNNTDILGRELEWHKRAIPAKYEPQDGQFAVGLGVAIGTLPDAAFTFNALGMLTLGFPDFSLLLAIDATVLSTSTSEASEESASSTSSGLTLLGIVSIDPEAVGLAIQADYTIPRLLTVQVPIGAYFPLQSSPQGGYFRVGSDGGGGRPDRPVTLRILPEVLDLRATSFFMVEERGLPALGKRAGLDFAGFAIGFGAGVSVKWGGSSIYLKVSLAVLVGLGTRPFVLAGGIYVKGELRLVIVSLSVTGELEARITGQGSQLRGQFCGKVDFFFFSIEGCVSFTVGSEPQIDPPPADPLISGLTLADKFARVVAEGAPSLGALSGSEAAKHTAWIDTTPVLRFAHQVRSAIPAGNGFQPTPSQGWASPTWSGTNRIRYLYELLAVELWHHPSSGSAVQIDTTDWPASWWLQTFRASIPETGSVPPSSHEGWDLALLHWDPSPWSRAHSDGGEGLSSDPADNLGRVCDPAPQPSRFCVRGEAGIRWTAERIELRAPPSGQLPYAGDFWILATEGLPPELTSSDLATLAEMMGLGFEPGSRAPLPSPLAASGESTPIAGAWRLPRLTRAGFTALSLGLLGEFRPAVAAPELLLAVCIELPDLGARERVCLDMAALKGAQDEAATGTIKLPGAVLRDRGRAMRIVDRFPLAGVNGIPELHFSAKGLEITLATATDSLIAEVGLLKDDRIRLWAYAADGRELASTEAYGQPPSVQQLGVTAPGIRRVILQAERGTGHLLGLCTFVDTFTDEDVLVKRILEFFQPQGETPPLTHAKVPRQLPLPRVVGLHGRAREPWPGEVVGAAIDGRHGCVYVRYAPKGDDPRPWTGFQILPYPWFTLGLLRVCGINAEALAAAAQDEATREEVQDLLNDAADPDPAAAIARYQLLEPGSRYELRVAYRAATWVGDKPTDEPPTASSVDLGSPPSVVTVAAATQSFFFRTAATASFADDAEILAFAAQGRFDPRGLVRYVRGFDPAAEDPSHLRSDPMVVWFEVEWVEDLLDRHGFDLEVSVQRTDPPPTPPEGPPAILFPPLEIAWEPLPYELLDLADQRIADALTDAPCVDGPPIDGATLVVTAPLEPRARYDLVISAKSRNGGEVTPIGLGHFRASRYEGVTDLIEALGFGFTSTHPFYPVDQTVAGAPPSDVALTDDALLDAALTTLGLDPLAPATAPRTLLLWREVAGEWRLVGALLDSDEPLVRPPRPHGTEPAPPRLELLYAEVSGVSFPADPRLRPVRSNAAGTRILLAQSAGIVVPPDQELHLAVQEPSGLRVARRSLPNLPLVVTQEQI